MRKETILVVDDEASVRTMLSLVLRSEGYDVYEAEDGDVGVKMILEYQPDVVLMDVRMPKLDGLSTYFKVSGKWQGACILMTAFGTVADAVEAMKAGVYDYIIKPFNIDDIKLVVKEALSSTKNNTNQAALGFHLLSRSTNSSQTIKSVINEASKVAPTSSTVFITGESGTGKELLANFIHYSSPRCDKPFIKVNCGALSENLLDSELFGHEKGAFTSASQRRIGMFELANKGTLFLDEIGEMPHSVQVKLLRVLQEKEFQRLGGNEVIKTDMRVIAATNRSLKELVDEGILRHDLYYRLAVVTLTLPPLRERVEDIVPLALMFVQRFSRDVGKKIDSLAPEAEEILKSHSWPGNIRELSNVIERSVIMNSGRALLPQSLPAYLFEGSKTTEEFQEEHTDIPSSIKISSDELSNKSLKDALKATERSVLKAALKRHHGNKLRTAKELGMSRRALQYKVEEYGLQDISQ